MSAESSSPRRWKHDVFLSFRGEDTGRGFTDHLYTALHDKGITTFRDDPALQKGEAISPSLFAAIEESRFAVIVLSQNYASSTWCLDELVKILECMKAREAVLPIFYDVDPFDVRKQTGSLGEAFANHEERFRYDKEKVRRWRYALTEVASFSGWNSKEWYEAKLIRHIVEVIWTKLQPTSFSYAENLVGIYSRDNRTGGSIGKMSTESSSPPWWNYDVFLSFRGTDTRKTFTDHLYTALLDKGITTFRDDPALQKGETISPALLAAIEESRFALIIFSQNYASSRWCLDELVKILECTKAREAVLPIFYDVDPFDVRKQTGSLGEAFANHEERFRYDKEKVRRWRNALTELASFSGWNSKGWYESKLVRDIVEVIWTKLQPTSFSYAEEEEAENEEEEDVVNELRTYDLLLSRLYSMYEEGLVTDYEKLKIGEHITKIKDLMSNMVTGNRHEDILRLIHGVPVAVINDRKCTINDPECIEDFNRIYDQMVELKKKSDHTYSAVMRTSKSTWSELPTEVFELILKKFVPSAFNNILIFKHILSFRAVCHTWRNAAKALFRYALLPQTPWLLVHTRCKSSIVDPEQKKVYEIQNVYGNHLHDVMCKGSSHGWMVVFHKNCDTRESLAYVVNPITRARTQIPGMATLSGSEGHSVEITKVVLSSDPSSNDFSVIVAYCIQGSVTGALAFCKNGDTSWSKLDYPHKYIFHDILFHHDHLFALTKKQSLDVWDFTESYPKMIFNIADTTPPRLVGHSYLVESMGEVLRVVRGGENTNSAHFLVEKLNVKDKKWEKVQNLGDQILFLFHDQSMSLPKTCFLGSEDNSIYFLQGGRLARGVIEKYNLETTEVREINSLSNLIGKELSSEELEFHSFPPVWVVPSL